MYDQVMLLRDHGRNDEGIFVRWGFNSRLDNFQAAILNYKIGYYNAEIEKRRKIASFYQNRLQDVRELLLPPAPDADTIFFDVYQNYEIEAERRDELKIYLKENGIGTLIQWNGQPVHSLTSLGFSGTGLPYTEAMFKKCLMIPMNTSLQEEDLEYVCDSISKFYR
jgi:dTDP-4-amino-4,6-dideoxygalactose transaminase